MKKEKAKRKKKTTADSRDTEGTEKKNKRNADLRRVQPKKGFLGSSLKKKKNKLTTDEHRYTQIRTKGRVRKTLKI